MSNIPKIYFNAGPTLLPKEVLQKAQSEFLDYQKSGISILETSHRSEIYKEINSNAQKSLRKLLSIPDEYEILFLQGGATGHFSAVPLNLTPDKNSKTDYIVTGVWSRKASKEAKNFSCVYNVLPGGECCVGIPDIDSWKRSDEPSYLYYCDNETVDGIMPNFIYLL
ncbi:Phosphoserine aminotransferase [Nymphon striatum]|nr:Phosphoserine aminotransferase [Nymphon striatum]